MRAIAKALAEGDRDPVDSQMIDPGAGPFGRGGAARLEKPDLTVPREDLA